MDNKVNHASAMAIVLREYPDARLTAHAAPGTRPCFRVESGESVLGEGRGPAMAWRSASRRVKGGEGPAATAADDLVKRAVAHLIEARALLDLAGAGPVTSVIVAKTHRHVVAALKAAMGAPTDVDG